jgi:hypothetical protein
VKFDTIIFCFQALLEKGLTKMQSFGQSGYKLVHACLLTPAGAAEKSKPMVELLEQKLGH